jgi:hypothetical protein
MAAQISYRGLDAADLDRIGEIDRTERIETMYVQRGTRLEEREGDWSALPWSSEGEGQHTRSPISGPSASGISRQARSECAPSTASVSWGSGSSRPTSGPASRSSPSCT